MFCSIYVCSGMHTHRQGWSEAHQIPTASWRGRSVAPGSFTKGDIPQAWHCSSGRTGSSIPSSPLQQHTCPVSAAPGTSTETSTLVLRTEQVKNLNFTKYALKKEEKLKKKQHPKKNIKPELTDMGPFLQSIQHPPARPSDRGPRNGWGRGPSKVEPLMGPTAQGCTFPQPLSPPRQTPHAVTPCTAPQTRSLQALSWGRQRGGTRVTWPSPSPQVLPDGFVLSNPERCSDQRIRMGTPAPPQPKSQHR